MSSASINPRTKYSLGKLVKVVVIRILPIGLLVKLPNGESGVIREREISWLHESPQIPWQEKFVAGQDLKSIVLSQEDDQIELSLRLVEDDPWANIEAKYSESEIVAGAVTGVEPFGAFVELEPGITGLLRHEKLPSWATGDMNELLWVGDRVKVCVESIDAVKRHVVLSMTGIRQQRWHHLELGVGTTNSRIVAPLPAAVAPSANAEQFAQIPPFSIVVIEDDEEQRKNLAEWLRNYGHAIFEASSAEYGQTLIEEYRPDFVFTDVGLPGQDGITSTLRNLKQYPEINFAVMTDWTRGYERGDELEELRTHGVHFMIKPLLPEDILRVFQAFLTSDNCTNEDGQLSPELSASPQMALKATEAALEDNAVFNSKTKHQLAAILQEAQRVSGASKIILFSVDLGSRQVESVVEVGKGVLNRGTFSDLIRSPVREAAEDGRTVLVDDAEQKAGYVRYLQPLLSFRSCYGAPVAGESFKQNALFFFAGKRNHFTCEITAYLEICSKTVASILSQSHLRRNLVEAHETIMLGTLTRGFVHEVNHHLSPINFAVDNLQDKCKEISSLMIENPEKATTEMALASEALSHLRAGVENLTKTARDFGTMTVQDRDAIIQVDQIVQRAIQLVCEMTDHASIKVNYHEPDQLLYTRAKASQIQQVVVNVVLNAIQHIRKCRPTVGGQVHVWLDRIPRGEQTYITITVSDDGPGIHYQLWERVFDLGYTTREGEGSGMGLYIGRSLIEAMRGQIQVESSYPLWGTRINIEIPVLIAEGEAP